jgi:ABC-type sugar transport system ATPase subunit
MEDVTQVERSKETPATAAAYRDVSKHFGATKALQGIDLEIKEGTIHALVGENGAGKSTALGLLAGRIAATSGEVELFGNRVPALNPREARSAGLAAIYQELTIAPELNAEANVFAARPLAKGGILSFRRMRRRYEELCEQLGVDAVPASVPAGRLSVAEQQLLEIMRAMAFDARLVLFDEPTASLGVAERRSLLALMERMRAQGKTLVFVSHNLEEVLQVADTVTVFRGGRLVASNPRSEVAKPDLVRAMLGEDADPRLLESLEEGTASEPRARARRSGPSGTVLRAEGVTLPGAVEGFDLEVAKGEILGLGGLVGCGRTSVLRSLAGLEPESSGRLWIDGEEVPWPKTVRRALSYGIALLPEDRKNQGLALEMDAAINVTMSDLGKVSRFGVISNSRMKAAAAAATGRVGFDAGRVGEAASHLSGGNQQKLLVARWCHSTPAVLLADEPSRGIDIGAKEDVYAALEQMAAEGLAVIVVSSELEELVAVSDRIEVLAEGRAVGSLTREDGLSVGGILDKAFSERKKDEH